MRTKTVSIYKFSELSDRAKQKAKDDYAVRNGYAFGDEALASLKALAEHFGAKLTNHAIDWFNNVPSYARFDAPEIGEPEIKSRLLQLGSYNHETLRGLGDCKLTGYCTDESAIDGFRIAFYKGECNLTMLLLAAFDSWLEDVQSDCQAQFTDEAFSEHCDANGYEFDEAGNIE